MHIVSAEISETCALPVPSTATACHAPGVERMRRLASRGAPRLTGRAVRRLSLPFGGRPTRCLLRRGARWKVRGGRGSRAATLGPSTGPEARSGVHLLQTVRGLRDYRYLLAPLWCRIASRYRRLYRPSPRCRELPASRRSRGVPLAYCCAPRSPKLGDGDEVGPTVVCCGRGAGVAVQPVVERQQSETAIAGKVIPVRNRIQRM
jgi:hypothetical protein